MSDNDVTMWPYELRFALPYLLLALLCHLTLANPEYRSVSSFITSALTAAYAAKRFSTDHLRTFRVPEFWQIWGASAAVVALVQMNLGAENFIRGSHPGLWLSPLVTIPAQGLLLALLYSKGAMNLWIRFHTKRTQARIS